MLNCFHIITQQINKFHALLCGLRYQSDSSTISSMLSWLVKLRYTKSLFNLLLVMVDLSAFFLKCGILIDLLYVALVTGKLALIRNRINKLEKG